MKRFVIVGAGARGHYLFADLFSKKYSDKGKIVGVYDINSVRAAAFKDKVGGDCKVYNSFELMLDSEMPDCVIVTTIDSTHHEYIIASLNKGYEVISEKPISNTFEKCLAIRQAERKSGKNVTVTFNCRYMPYFEEIKKLLLENRIGKVLAVNYDYCLDRLHGGDYFKRWHKYMKNSESLLLHKSSHHFDIINWFLQDEPLRVCALANQIYYNSKDKMQGERCSQCEFYKNCESNDMQSSNYLKALYFDAEGEDGYIRDRCAFAGEGDIYDNMSLSAIYKSGTLLTYTLNLFSHHEGFRLTITGERGTIIAEDWSDERENRCIKLLNSRNALEKIPFIPPKGTHNGGDDNMLLSLFEKDIPDPLSQKASSLDGMISSLIGIAGNISIKEGRTVNLSEYIEKLR